MLISKMIVVDLKNTLIMIEIHENDILRNNKHAKL
jgi:hypothetical protein